MSATPLPNARFFVRDPETDEPLAGGLVYTYEPGTTIPKATYADAQSSAALPNPVQLAADGGANIFFSGIYRVIVRRADGTLVSDVDYFNYRTATFEGGFSGQMVFVTSATYDVSEAEGGSFLHVSRPTGVTLSLPGPSDISSGFMLTVKNIGSAGNCIIDPYQSEQIDGMPTLELRPGESALIAYDGTAWRSYFRNNAASKRAYIGEYIHLSGNTAPLGTVEANGAAVSRTTRALLWAWVQASGNLAASEGVKTAGQYGPGDGSTTFTLPNLYADGGYFLRPITAGRDVGNVQADMFAEHDHDATFAGAAVPNHTHTVPGSSGGGAGGVLSTSGGGLTPVDSAPAGGHTPAGTVTIDPEGGTETRPKNIGVRIFIQAE